MYIERYIEHICIYADIYFWPLSLVKVESVFMPLCTHETQHKPGTCYKSERACNDHEDHSGCNETSFIRKSTLS